MKYYVAPTIYNLSNIKIVPVEVIREEGRSIVVESKLTNVASSTFRTFDNFLYDNMTDALDALDSAVVEFTKELTKVYNRETVKAEQLIKDGK